MVDFRIPIFPEIPPNLRMCVLLLHFLNWIPNVTDGKSFRPFLEFASSTYFLILHKSNNWMQLGMQIQEDGWPLLFSVYSIGNNTLVIEIILSVTLCSIDQLPPACWWGQLRASVAGSLRRFRQYHANKMLYCCVSLTEPYTFFNNMINCNLGSRTKLNSHTIKN